MSYSSSSSPISISSAFTTSTAFCSSPLAFNEFVSFAATNAGFAPPVAASNAAIESTSIPPCTASSAEIPPALTVAAFAAMYDASVLNADWTALLIRRYSRNVSSDPVSISNEFHVAQNSGFDFAENQHEIIERGMKTNSRIAELTSVRKDRSRSIDFSELAFESGESETHFGSLSIRQLFDSSFVDRSRCRESKVGRRFRNVVRKHLRSASVFHPLRESTRKRTSIRSAFSTAEVARS